MERDEITSTDALIGIVNIEFLVKSIYNDNRLKG